MARKLDPKPCEICGKEFIPKYSEVQCCSPHCSAKLRCIKRGTPPWRTEEDELLEKMAGSKPIQKIIEAVQRLDKKNGWAKRTSCAIRWRIRILGLSADCTEDNLSAQKLAKEFGINISRVRLWISLGLPCSRVANRKLGISLKDLKEWAKQNPEQFAGIEYFRLVWAFEDEVFAMRLSQLKPSGRGRRRRLRRIDTGQRFESVKDAAKSIYVSRQALNKHVRKIEASGMQRFTAFDIPWEILEA